MPKKSRATKNVSGFQKYFIVAGLLILLILLGTFASPFVVDLLIAGVIVTAVQPLHERILRLTPFSRSLGAIISMLLITVVVLLPFTLFAFFLVRQAGDAYLLISEKIHQITQEDGGVSFFSLVSRLPFVDRLEPFLQNLPITTNDVLQTLGDSLGLVSSFLLGQTTNILKHLSLFLLHVIVFLMILFYFLRDGSRLVNYLKALLPLSESYREELFGKLGQLSYGIIYGIFGGAILQGFLVGLAFWVAGFSNAAFWGAVAALFAPLPYIGVTIIWIPAFIILAVGGQWVTAVVFLLWCMAVVGTADNFIKPYLIGASSALNPLALLIVILGGTFVFGLKGLLFGPFILTLTLSFLHIYQLEYEGILEDIKKSPQREGKPILIPKIKKLIGVKSKKKK